MKALGYKCIFCQLNRNRNRNVTERVKRRDTQPIFYFPRSCTL